MSPGEITVVLAIALACAALALAVVVLASVAALIGVLPHATSENPERGAAATRRRTRLVSPPLASGTHSS